MTNEQNANAADVETPAEPMLTTSATSSSLAPEPAEPEESADPVESLTPDNFIGDLFEARAKTVAANEAANARRALGLSDDEDKAAE